MKAPPKSSKGPVTVKDIAAAVGIHFTTVAHILRDPETPKASAKTRAQVTKAAARLGYQGNILASKLRKGLGGLAVVYLVPNREFLFYPYYQEVLAGLQEHFGQEGRTLSVFGATPETRATVARQIDSSLYAGMLVMGPEPCPELEAAAARVPTLQLNYRTPSPHRSYLMRDERQAARLTFERLHRAGYRKVKAVFLYRHPAQSERQTVYGEVVKEFPGMEIAFEFLSETSQVLYSQAMLKELHSGLTTAKARRLVDGCDVVLSLSTYGELIYVHLKTAGIDIPGKMGFMMDGMMYVEQLYFPEINRVGVSRHTITAKVLEFFKDPKPGMTIPMASTLQEGETLRQLAPVP